MQPASVFILLLTLAVFIAQTKRHHVFRSIHDPGNVRPVSPKDENGQANR